MHEKVTRTGYQVPVLVTTGRDDPTDAVDRYQVPGTVRKPAAFGHPHDVPYGYRLHCLVAPAPVARHPPPARLEPLIPNRSRRPRGPIHYPVPLLGINYQPGPRTGPEQTGRCLTVNRARSRRPTHPAQAFEPKNTRPCVQYIVPGESLLPMSRSGRLPRDPPISLSPSASAGRVISAEPRLSLPDAPPTPSHPSQVAHRTCPHPAAAYPRSFLGPLGPSPSESATTQRTLSSATGGEDQRLAVAVLGPACPASTALSRDPIPPRTIHPTPFCSSPPPRGLEDRPLLRLRPSSLVPSGDIGKHPEPSALRDAQLNLIRYLLSAIDWL